MGTSEEEAWEGEMAPGGMSVGREQGTNFFFWGGGVRNSHQEEISRKQVKEDHQRRLMRMSPKARSFQENFIKYMSEKFQSEKNERATTKGQNRFGTSSFVFIAHIFALLFRFF